MTVAMSDEWDQIIIAIGGKGCLGNRTLRMMQGAVALVHAQSPGAAIMLVIDGYDDDPRELWEIPEVVRYIQRYAVAAGLWNWTGELFKALDETTKGVLIACDAIAQPHPFEVRHGGRDRSPAG